MPFKVGSNDMGDIYVGSAKIGQIFVGSDLVYSAATDDLRFNYIGIDASGYDEASTYYNGNPVAYALGQYKYTYNRYTQFTPTPTEASGYSGKSVYDTSTSKYVSCSYNSGTSTLTPSWIEVGVTPCYTVSTEFYYTKQTETDTLKFASASVPTNSVFNKTYWGDSIDAEYTSADDVPTIPELETLVLPDTYRGKPVTVVKAYQFYGASYGTQVRNFYAPYRITNLTLGANITKIETFGFAEVCRTSTGGLGTFTLNNKIALLYDCSLGGVFSNGSTRRAVVLPSTVTQINAQTFGPVYSTNYPRSVPKLTITSPTISCISQGSYGIVDHCNYVIFENTVTSISGTLKHTTSSPSGAIVFKHSQNQSITLSISKEKSAIACTIYTDCDAVLNYDWASQNYTVTFKPLSEYTGG